MSISVQLRTDPTLFQEVDWTALLRQSAVDTLFLTPQWQEVWWQHWGQDRELRVLLAYQGDTLVGVAPLYALQEEGQTILQLIGGVDVSDYLDWIVRQGHEEAVYRAFAHYLRDEAPPWDVLDLHCLPGHSPTRLGLLQQACGDCYGGTVQVRQEDPVLHIPLPGEWEEYLGMLDKKQRHEIRRKLRRAEATAEARWYRLQDGKRLEEEVTHFIALHRASHPEKDAFMTPRMERFFRDMADVTWAAGWLNLYLLWLDGRPAAAMWCFDYGNDLQVYNSGYDPAWRPELSSGNVLLSYCLQDAITRGKARFDFMRGGETYKYRFGAVEDAVYQLVARHTASTE